MRRKSLLLLLAVMFLVGTSYLVISWINRQSLLELAQEAIQNDQYEKAKKYLQQAVQKNSKDAEAYYLLGRVERLLNHYSEAEKYLQQAIEIGGSSEKLQFEFVLLRAVRGDFDELLPGLWHCVEEGHPQRLHILETMVGYYITRNEFGAALETINTWLAYEPRSSKAYHFRGWINEKMEHKGAAEKDYLKAIEYNPNNLFARMQLVSLQMDQSWFDKARPHVQFLLQHNPDYHEVLYLAARMAFSDIALDAGNADQCRVYLDKLLKIVPQHPLGHQLYGELEYQEGNYVEAEKWFRKTIEIRPNLLTAYHLLASTLTHLGKEEEAKPIIKYEQQLKTDFDRLSELTRVQLPAHPNDISLYIETVDLSIRCDVIDDAISWINLGFRLDKTNPPLRRLFAICLEKRGKMDEAKNMRLLADQEEARRAKTKK